MDEELFGSAIQPMEQPNYSPIPSLNIPGVTPDLNGQPLHDFEAMQAARFNKSLEDFKSKPSTVDHRLDTVTTTKPKDLDRFKQSGYFGEFGYDFRRDQLDNPHVTNEALYGYRQTLGNTIGNALKGMTSIAGNTFVEGFKDWGRIANALFNWGSDKSFTERLVGSPEELQAINDRQQAIFNKYAIFGTPESEATFWNRKTFGNLLQQSGFAVGTTLQFMAENALTGGVGGAILKSLEGAGEAISLGKKLGTIADVAKRVRDLRKIGEPLEGETSIAKLWDLVKKNTPVVSDINKVRESGGGVFDMTVHTLGSFKRGMSELNMANTEAVMEGAGTYTQTKQQMLDAYKKQHGVDATGQDLDSINKQAYDAATSNTMFNDAVLLASNRLAFDGLFKSVKGSQSLLREAVDKLEHAGLKKVTGEIEGKLTTQYFKKGVKSLPAIGQTFGKDKMFKEAGKMLLSHAGHFEVNEGLQELLQNASNDYYTNYFYTKYNNDLTGKQDVNKAFLQSLSDNTFNMDGLKTFIMGAATGLLISGPTHLATKGFEMASDRVQDSKLSEEAKAKREENKASVDADIANINDFLRDPTKVMSPIAAHLNTQIATATSLDQALRDKDQFAFEDLQDTALASLAEKSYALGTHQALIDTMRDWGANFSDDQFKEAFGSLVPEQSYVPNQGNKAIAKAFTDKIANSLEDYYKFTEELEDIIPTKDPSYVRGESRRDAMEYNFVRGSVISLLAKNRFKAQQSFNRLNEIYSNLSSTPNFGASLGTTMYTLASEASTKAEAANLREYISSTEGGTLNAAGRLDLALKKKQLAVLDQILNDNVHKRLLTAGDSAEFYSKLNKQLQSYFKLKNEEYKIQAPLSVTDVENHVNGLQRYMKLNNQYGGLVQAYNALIDHKNYKEVVGKMKIGSALAQFQLFSDNIKQFIKDDPELFEYENKELFDKFNAFRQKINDDKGFTEDTSKEFEDLSHKLRQKAIEFANGGLDAIHRERKAVKESPLFRAAYKDLLDKEADLEARQKAGEDIGDELNEVSAQIRDHIKQFIEDRNAEKAQAEKAAEDSQKKAEANADVTQKAAESTSTTVSIPSNKSNAQLSSEAVSNLLEAKALSQIEALQKKALSSLNPSDLGTYETSVKAINLAAQDRKEELSKSNPVSLLKYGVIVEIGKNKWYKVSKPSKEGEAPTVEPIDKFGTVSNSSTTLSNAEYANMSKIYQSYDEFKKALGIESPATPTPAPLEQQNPIAKQVSEPEEVLSTVANPEKGSGTTLLKTADDELTKSSEDPAVQTWHNVINRLGGLDSKTLQDNYKLVAVSADYMNTNYLGELDQKKQEWIKSHPGKLGGVYVLIADKNGKPIRFNSDGTSTKTGGRLAINTLYTDWSKTSHFNISAKDRAIQQGFVNGLKAQLNQKEGWIPLDIDYVSAGMFSGQSDKPRAIRDTTKIPGDLTLTVDNGVVHLTYKGATTKVVRPIISDHRASEIMYLLMNPNSLADTTPVLDKDGNPKMSDDKHVALKDWNGVGNTIRYIKQFIDVNKVGKDEALMLAENKYAIRLDVIKNDIKATVYFKPEGKDLITTPFTVNSDTSKENMELLDKAIRSQGLNIPTQEGATNALADKVKLFNAKKIGDNPKERTIDMSKDESFDTVPLKEYLINEGFMTQFDESAGSDRKNRYIVFKPSTQAVPHEIGNLFGTPVEIKANPLQKLVTSGKGENYQNYFIYNDGEVVRVIKLNPLEEVTDVKKKGVILSEYNKSKLPKVQNPAEVFIPKPESSAPLDIINDWKSLYKGKGLNVNGFLTDMFSMEGALPILHTLGIRFTDQAKALAILTPNMYQGANPWAKGIAVALQEYTKMYPGKLLANPIEALWSGEGQWKGVPNIMEKLAKIEGLQRTAAKPVEVKETPKPAPVVKKGRSALASGDKASPLITSSEEKSDGFENNLGCK